MTKSYIKFNVNPFSCPHVVTCDTQTPEQRGTFFFSTYRCEVNVMHNPCSRLIIQYLIQQNANKYDYSVSDTTKCK